MADTYPRPDFQRPHLTWQNLNGTWDFAFDDTDVGLSETWHRRGLPQEHKRDIKVPFVFQCPASGINDRGAHEVIWYQRQIPDPRSTGNRSDRVLLRFGAVDYEATIWVDGEYVGSHRGGHVPFEIDVTDVVAGKKEARLTLRIYDSAYDLTQPRGKQYWHPIPDNIFYTPSSGIWQTVWLEAVPPARIGDGSAGTVLRSDDIAQGVLRANVFVLGRRSQQKLAVEVEASIAGTKLGNVQKKELSKETDNANLDVIMRLSPPQMNELPAEFLKNAPKADAKCWSDGVALWTPEQPLLYDLTIRLLDADGKKLDEVNTTTGMRSLNWSAGDGSMRLNGHPYFQALVLDQGYWPETFMTPPNSNSCKEDVEMSKAMGFNGCRKHQKVEDPLFLYWADRLGYVVWGEMANSYEFSSEYAERFNQEWVESIKRDINHPCIWTWTPVNESWGYPNLDVSVEQRNHIRTLYYITKTLDPTRSVNDDCGWEHVCNELSTFHDYSDAPELTAHCASLSAILEPKGPGKRIFVDKLAGNQRPISTPNHASTTHAADVAHANSSHDAAEVKHKPGAPVLCTEFGGVNIAPSKEGEKGERDWGYTTASDPKDLVKRVEALVVGMVKGGECCGFVYTQLADIEQEVNGLYSFDRKPKLDVGAVKGIMDNAQKMYFEIRKEKRLDE